MKTDPDRELVRACQERRTGPEEEPFRTLYERHEARVYNVCYRTLRNHADALDASQETFLRVFRNLQRFRFESRFTSWLHRVAVNACLELARRERSRRGRAPEAVEGVQETLRALSEERQDALGPERALVAAETASAVGRALGPLSPALRETLRLRHFEGLTYADIARRMGVAEGTVKSRLNRAHVALWSDLLPLHQELSRRGLAS